jgi:hypothetical protein
MQVLVWQSHGNVRVLAAETPFHFVKIFGKLQSEMAGWGEDEALAKLDEQMRKCQTQNECEKLFTRFIVRHLDTHETFETFEFMSVENV